MRATLLSGFALLAVIAASTVAPVHAQTTGGISITHGGGNVNVAKGALSEADQGVTTLGGIAAGHGVVFTNGGNNRNTAAGALSFAGQNITTLGGTALGPRARHHQRRQQPQHRARLRQCRHAVRRHPGRDGLRSRPPR